MGDCIDCFRCVTVCPTGMDIRRGLQLECISCMACMDACDEVMRNVKKPTGLIRYTSQNEMAGLKRKTFRPRVLVLSAALTVVLSGLSWVLLTRPPIKAAVFNAKTGAYQTLQEPTAKQAGLYGNQFYLVASNYSFEDGQVRIKSENPEIKVVTQMNPVPLKAGGEKQIGFFLTFPKSVLQAGIARLKLSLETQAEDKSWQRTLTQEVSLVGPH
jgi:ferredoxin